MTQEQRGRAIEVLQAAGLQRAIFTHPASITWLTGFTPAIQLGPHLFAGGVPLLVYEAGQFSLFVAETYAAQAREFATQPACQVLTHLDYTYEEPLAGEDHFIESLRLSLGSFLASSAKIGIEKKHLPLPVAEFLSEARPAGLQAIAIDGWLEPFRMIKTKTELEIMRKNFALADIGQEAARRRVEAGAREIEIWTAAHGAIQEAAGRRVPLGNDCVVGHRQLNFTGWPEDYEIHSHDSLIVDLGTGLEGYWSDGCATYYPGEPTREQTTMHQTVMEALDLALSLIRPGAVCQEIDQQVRQFLANSGYPDYPHHTGHGIGVRSHEAPRLVPYSQEVLQPGMVIMIEPGIYFPGKTGVRLELGVLVTADGAQILSGHDIKLP